MLRATRILFILLALVLFVACHDKEDEVVDEGTETAVRQYTVAVILPLKDATLSQRWHRIAEWLQENLAKAQQGREHPVQLNIEWIEENADDEEAYLSELGEQLAHRDDVMAVIGPQTSAHCELVAGKLSMTNKLMITPAASADELFRMYAGKDFFWSISGSDIAQIVALLSVAKNDGARKVSLVVGNSIYAQTFLEWFYFETEEMGLELKGIYDMEDVKYAMEDTVDYCVCVPDKSSEVQKLVEARREAPSYNDHCKLLFSDIAVDLSLLSNTSLDGIQGISPYTTNATGFIEAYRKRFSTMPVYDEMALYDALLSAALTIVNYDKDIEEGTKVSQFNKMIDNHMKTIMAVTNAAGDSLPTLSAWDADGMAKAIQQPGAYNISGASGALDFDVSVQCGITTPMYCHWVISEKQYLPISYYTLNTSPYSDSCVWQPSVIQTIPNEDVDISYPSLQSKWAVLVCGSRGWYNYRHQADVLNVYQLLRESGYDDDHIILIASPDEVVNNSRNKYPGEIRNKVNGKNLYHDVVLDYCTDTLYATDIHDILIGNQSQHLPTVLHTDEHSNVLFYWTGHGALDKFLWRDSYHNYDFVMMQRDITQMNEENRYRKMLICAEPCYSGSVVSGIIGIPAVFAIASATDGEMSYGEQWDANMSLWLSDRFTNTLVSTLRQTPSISFHDLYLNLVQNTYGSHVTLVNYWSFDNLYKSSPIEFFRY